MAVLLENDPSLHPDLFKLPIQPDGTPITYSLSARPYIEASVGVANIFKFIRVDLVKADQLPDHLNVSTLWNTGTSEVWF